MNSDEYHAADRDEDSSNYMACRFCGLPHGDHEGACPRSEPTGFDDPERRGREEDRYENQLYGELREGWQGP